MDRKKIIILVSVFLVILAIISLATWKFFFHPDYYAVYLSTGDIYFGKLTCFSKYVLKDPYYLRMGGNEGTPITVESFQEAFWGPGETLRLNPENVIWISKLNPASPVKKYIEARTQGAIIPQQSTSPAPQNLEGETE